MYSLITPSLVRAQKRKLERVGHLIRQQKLLWQFQLPSKCKRDYNRGRTNPMRTNHSS